MDCCKDERCCLLPFDDHIFLIHQAGNIKHFQLQINLGGLAGGLASEKKNCENFLFWNSPRFAYHIMGMFGLRTLYE